MNRIPSILLYISFLFFSCGNKDKKTLSIEGYDTHNMKETNLGKPLKEISGLAYDSRFHNFLSINDEKGILYCLDTTNFNIIKSFPFGENGDYEEVQILNDLVYVLRSDGSIFKMKYDGKNVSEVTTSNYDGEKAEYEAFYIDSIKNELVLIPKKSFRYFNKRKIIAYIMDAGTLKYKPERSIELNWDDLNNKIIHPSSVSIHPVTKQIYLLSSIENLLVIMDPAWNVLSEHHLNKKQFRQVEGISFDANLNMYITNEGDEEDKCSMLFIPKSKN